MHQVLPPPKKRRPNTRRACSSELIQDRHVKKLIAPSHRPGKGPRTWPADLGLIERWWRHCNAPPSRVRSGAGSRHSKQSTLPRLPLLCYARPDHPRSTGHRHYCRRRCITFTTKSAQRLLRSPQPSNSTISQTHSDLVGGFFSSTPHG
jgi:hypothetical protein